MSATHATDPTRATSPVLYLAFELSWTSWKLAFTIGAGQKPRLRSIPARGLVAVGLEIQKAKQRFGLPGDAHPWSPATRPAATASGPIASRSRRGPGTSSSIRPRSTSIAASAASAASAAPVKTSHGVCGR